LNRGELTILVVDDEPNIVEVLGAYLKRELFNVVTASDGESALRQVAEHAPDLIVLDVMLPGVDGLELCRRIQQESNVYVLMLTARAEEVDKIVGLSVGADDYMSKPFSPRELVARVKAVLRRNRAHDTADASTPERPPLVFGDLTINPEAREVAYRGKLIDLTQREFELLYALADQPGRVFSRDHLLERVWGHDFAGIDRVVDVTVGVLRRKLDDDPTNPALIQTIRGIGYKMAARRAR
jgi:two-component system alkaline phosphatase synthesis response regulator PhoP